MQEPETMSPNEAAETGAGFRVSDQPVVKARRLSPSQTRATAAESRLPADDVLYVIARDPQSLFVYWNLDLSSRLAAAGLGDRQLHLRVLRDDGSEELVTEIDPALGYAFVAVSSPGTRYRCELGLFDDSEWQARIRSGLTETPAAAISEDLEADFATLPFHLGFQRLVDIFRASRKDRKFLTLSIAEMQTKARALQASMPAADWSKLLDAAAAAVDAEAGFGLSEVETPEIAALLRTVKCDLPRRVPSPEKLARVRALGESFGGSSWSGANSESFGPGSRS